MAQKDKVKELVGRGLDSYHTKALQQMDRIEKKNKEQNHKISILSNELDNDYLTKTEEGSVISLEHSKEGMVYLDELQGNTLVNYCTDGSKEMTLNGDIDVEGVSVTTTEGVDNGLVDVVCEGNTLVNLFNYNNLSHNINTHVNRVITLPHGGVCDCIFPTKTNVIYTVMLDIIDLPTDAKLRVGLTDSNQWHPSVDIDKSGFHKIKLENKGQAIDRLRIHQLGLVAGDGKVIRVKDIMILEGDWTNKELPPYFEGMKSVGQDDENGHKIEILSRNKNLWNVNEYGLSTGIYAGVQITKLENGFKLNGTSTSSFTRHSSTNYLDIFEKGKTYILTSEYFNFEITYANGTKNWRKLVTVTDDVVKVTCYLQWLEKIITFDNLILTPQIEEGSVATSYLAPSLNKKEILLNEPLRGLPNGVRDRFVKIGGKWFIERNCSIEFNLADYNFEILNQDDTIIRFRANSNNFSKLKHSNNGVCNILNYYQAYNLNHSSIEGIGIKGDSNYVLINLNKSRNILSVNDLKNFIKNGLVFSDLQTPTYEPIEDAELITYLDITHISNNSIIPCNMKIKNSGYNAIIKPSTLYTIALDTNKSGTIGMNLGGTKGTTTNNVLTLTTPATLTDDSLRLHGKGIKGSKVRLLEGDKTNWIPSHFEGMKSSFEDKFDATDNTYKMEILSNNENLITPQMIINANKGFTIENINGEEWILSNNNAGYGKIYGIFEPNTQYSLSYKGKSDDDNWGIRPAFHYSDGSVGYLNYSGNNALIHSNSIKGKTVVAVSIDIPWYHQQKNTKLHIDTLQLKKTDGDNKYIKPIQNKIQFSSIEPLRGVDNIKDRLCFKNNKLMIERNCAELIIDNTNPYSISGNNSSYPNVLRIWYSNSHLPNWKPAKSLCNTLPSYGIMNKNMIGIGYSNGFDIHLPLPTNSTISEVREYLKNNPLKVVHQLIEPTYEEIPFELQKIILEGYENGTLLFDTNIPPTSTVTYAGETPIAKSVKLNKTEVLNNTTDINDNIIPYLMDMDYRVVCLELATETQGISMARLFGGAYEMLQRDIQSKRYSIDEYRHRLDVYLGANKITEEEYNKLGDMLNE